MTTKPHLYKSQMGSWVVFCRGAEIAQQYWERENRALEWAHAQWVKANPAITHD